jgi:hypothetical protein
MLWLSCATNKFEQNDNIPRQMYLSQQMKYQNDDIEELILDDEIKIINISQLNLEEEEKDLKQIDLRVFDEYKPFPDMNGQNFDILREDKFDEQTKVLIQSMQNLNNFEIVPTNKNISIRRHSK